VKANVIKCGRSLLLLNEHARAGSTSKRYTTVAAACLNQACHGCRLYINLFKQRHQITTKHARGTIGSKTELDTGVTVIDWGLAAGIHYRRHCSP
jgi:hypothetical protein